MRKPPLLSLLAGLLACQPTAVEDAAPVELTLRLTLAGGGDVGVTPGRVWVFNDSAPLPRAAAFPENGQPCVLATTPVTTCTLSAARFSYVSLVVSEPDPAVLVRFSPRSPDDTLRDGRYVEFTGWTECPDRAERGLCVIRMRNDTIIEANFQLMQQVSVYQTGAASMDFVMFAAAPTLKVPAQGYNILDIAGCRRLLNPPAAPCDAIRPVGDAPYHRFTAYVPRQTIVGMFPTSGAETEFIRWDGDCILSGLYGGGVCSFISPDTSGAPILLTVRYTWWQCASGPSDRDTGGCVLRDEPVQSARHKAQNGSPSR